MRIARRLAYLTPFLLLAGCTGYNTTQHPSYGGGATTGSQVISAPRTGTKGSVYSGASSGSWSGTGTDSVLISDIRRAMGQDQDLRTTASQVQVTSQNGAVTLSGSVPDQQTRDSVIALVRQTPGVVRITDQMYVSTVSSAYPSQRQSAPIYSSSGSSSSTESTSSVGSASGASGQIFSMQVDSLTDTDRNLAQRILQGLRTDTSLTTMLPRVNINVSEGRVLLQGQVQNDEQRRTIEDVVRRAARISNVENQLQVRP